MSDDLLGYKFLKSANLQEQLIKATVTQLKYEDMKAKLKRIFSNESEDSINKGIQGVTVKSEPTFYTMHEGEFEDEVGFYADNGNAISEEDCANTFYTTSQNREHFPNTRRGGNRNSQNYYRPTPRYGGASFSNWRTTEPQTNQKRVSFTPRPSTPPT